MFNLFLLWFGVFVGLFCGRGNLVFENVVFRQQLAVLKGRPGAAPGRCRDTSQETAVPAVLTPMAQAEAFSLFRGGGVGYSARLSDGAVEE